MIYRKKLVDTKLHRTSHEFLQNIHTSLINGDMDIGHDEPRTRSSMGVVVVVFCFGFVVIVGAAVTLLLVCVGVVFLPMCKI